MLAKKWPLWLIVGLVVLVPALKDVLITPWMTYRPLIRPVKFVLTSTGIGISGDETVVTPLGSFSFGVGFPPAPAAGCNGNVPLGNSSIGALLPSMSQNQILVVIRDTSQGKDSLYRLDSGRNLRVVSNGGTVNDIQSDGVVVIDVTQGQIETIEISDRNPATGGAAMPSNKPRVSGAMKNLVPQFGDLPSSFQLVRDTALSNEETARSWENPDAALYRYQQWGREGAYAQTYLHYIEGCASMTDRLSAETTVALYNSIAGAQQAIQWLITDSQSRSLQTQSTDKVGEIASLFFGNSKLPDSEPSVGVREVDLRFQRYNATALVKVKSTAGTYADDFMVTLAIRLAQLMDARLAMFYAAQ